MQNAVDWFEIPVTDLARARKFYETVLGKSLLDWSSPSGDTSMLYAAFLFDIENCTVGGVLVKGKGYEPSDKGSVVILNGGDDLSEPLSRVKATGGKILLPEYAIGTFGFLAYFLDSEGNRVALHSRN